MFDCSFNRAVNLTKEKSKMKMYILVSKNTETGVTGESLYQYKFVINEVIRTLNHFKQDKYLFEIKEMEIIDADNKQEIDTTQDS
jgi:hypothetical protein